MNRILPWTIYFLILIFSCKKESFITSPDAEVTITADTLHYDTVFTSAGSITQSFKIINENDQKLHISNVQLMGGNASPFRISVDGFTDPDIYDLEIEANDSLYVFVSVLINPNTNNLSFLIRDSIRVNFNGNETFVQLEAWGQNAHFYRNKKVNNNETWINDLPYVILGGLYVDTNATLNINKGCRIYVHADAPWIIDGSLKVNGEKDILERVFFQGDRLDEPYKDFPASWPGIYFSGISKDNVFNYSIIKNAYQALVVEDPSINANAKITLNQCIIDNAYDAGIIALNSSIRAVNCLISNCGKNLFLVSGGNYGFTHCTVVSYSNSFIQHKDPVLFLSNFIRINNVPVSNDLNALFRNCIFWGENGTVKDEVIVAKDGTKPFNVNFEYGLFKVETSPPNATQMLNNQSPQFDSINTSKRYYDFRLKSTSPAINKGTNAGITIDLDGKTRPVGLPDAGAYERQ